MAITQVSGSGTETDPYVLSGSGDITAYVLANDYIQLSGGDYTVDIPGSGTGITEAGNGQGVVDNDNNVATTTPVLTYTAIMSGTGQVTVTNSQSTTQPTLYQELSGGVLKLTAVQTLTNPNGDAYVIDSNTLLSVYGGDGAAGGGLAPGVTVTNNGELYDNQDSYNWTTINGTGNLYFENNDFNEMLIGGTSSIHGNLLWLYGEYITASTVLPASLSIVSTDINVVQAGGGRPNSFFTTYNSAADTVINGNYYADGPDTQIQISGVAQFNGQSFIIVRNQQVAGVQGVYDAAEAAKYDYFYTVSDEKGRVFYLTGVNETILFGDGQTIVNTAVPVGAPSYVVATNNTFIQGNPYNQNLIFHSGQFDYSPITTEAQAATLQTYAFDYSGTYTFNGGVNQLDGDTSASSYNSIADTDNSADLGPTVGDASTLIPGGETYSDLVVVDPGSGAAPNHLILTQPFYAQGITEIQTNAILQLGDGTTGTPYGATFTAITNGVTTTSQYNASGGNGALVTEGNALPVYQDPAYYSIVDNGQIVIDNAPDARDMIFAAADVYTFMSQNELDNISGTGSLLQEGQLALTLEGNTSYSGATEIAAGTTIFLKANSITGTTGLPNSQLNLEGTASVFDISQADPLTQLAGLSGATGSTIALGANTLQVAVNTNMIFSGLITDGGIGGGISGALIKTGAGTLELAGLGLYTGATSIEAGAIILDHPGSFSSSTIDFGANTSLIVGATGTESSTLANFAFGDTIQLNGFTATSYTFISGVGLELSDGAASKILKIDGGYSTNSFLVATTASGTDVTLLCYLRGTKILTPAGEIPIEDLRIGDTAVTRFNGYRQIKWIGRQIFSKQFASKNKNVIPVRLRAGALAPKTPSRDLLVSPGHSMLIGGVLVLASALVNGVSITQDEPPDEISYFQLEFDTHDCVLADGAWSESYADLPGWRKHFHNAAEFHTLYPDHTPPEKHELCAPRPREGLVLEAALRPSIARARSTSGLGPLRGWVDEISPAGRIRGWAQDAHDPELAVALKIDLDGRTVGAALACHYRADLVASGLGSGRCAFAHMAPMLISSQSNIRVYREADGAALRIGADALSFVI